MHLSNWFLKLGLMLQATGQGEGIMGPIPSAPPQTGGLLGPIVDLVILVIVTLQAFTGSWGLAIILTALIVKLLMFRLSVAQFTGMAWMQVLAPMQKELIAHFKGDKETANKKTMELYQELKINPLSGCLPLLIQLPIFFAIFRALYNPDVFGKAKFLGIHLMYAALPALSMGRYPGMDKVIDLGEQGVVSFMLGKTNVFLYVPALAIVVAYIATSLFYQHQMKTVQKRLPKYDFGNNAEPQKQPFNPNIMMFVVVIFGMIIPSGAMLYFITQNLYSIFEYHLIMNSAIAAIKSRNLEQVFKDLTTNEPKTAQPSSDTKSISSEQTESAPNGGIIEGDGEASESVRKSRRRRRKR